MNCRFPHVPGTNSARAENVLTLAAASFAIPAWMRLYSPSADQFGSKNSPARRPPPKALAKP